ncbi:MAG: biotin/lipoyl-containing protein [Candidatus Promineifilaceae bacterium]
MKYITTINDQEFIIEIDQEDRIRVNGEDYQVDFEELAEGGVLSLLLDNHSLEALVEEREDSWEVLIHGELYSVRVQDERAYRLAKARGAAADLTGETTIRSPMPGLIVAVPAVAGQSVHKGDKLVILESMKMENELRSPRAGVVKQVMVTAGDSVEKDQALVTVGDA